MPIVYRHYCLMIPEQLVQLPLPTGAQICTLPKSLIGNLLLFNLKRQSWNRLFQ